MSSINPTPNFHTGVPVLDGAFRSGFMIELTAADPDLSDCAVAVLAAELFCPFSESLDCCKLFDESLFSLIAKLVGLFELSGFPLPPEPTELF